MASIETTPYGKYRVRWRAAGVQHARNFDRKADAQQFASKMSRAPRERSRDRITLEEMADEWLASARNLSAGSQQKCIPRQPLIPSFSLHDLSELDNVLRCRLHGLGA